MNRCINIEDDATPVRRLDFDMPDENKKVEDDIVHCDDGEERITKRHSIISNDKIPKIGMEFDTEDVAYSFYNDYAKEAGFSIRRHVAHTDSSKRILDRIYLCSCEGHKKQDKRDATVKRRRPATRRGCLAMMKVNVRQTGRYRIEKFIAAHGHELASPDKSHMLRSHRIFTAKDALQADDIDSSGITPKAGFELMAKQVGGRENVGFIIEDYKNYLRTKRTVEMKTGDTGGVLEYLQERQLEDSNFFYAIQVDTDDLIANIFWADAQMRADFVYFGDVICFDTTYRKNKDGRPFALFVGVNHHKQTTIFGAALLYDETADTFMWLFSTFSRAMFGKKPKTILTDQDAAMAKALALKWPEVYHRLCIWHIYQNAATHLKDIFESFADFARDFSSCIYDYEEEEDFFAAWENMLKKYKLQSNEWLKRMFDLREKWALVYGRQAFFGDMTNTQRSESMNSSLKRYVSYKHHMLQFFKHFQRLVDERRYQELKADLQSSQSTPELSFPVAILKHALGVYTHEVFRLFQNELSKAYDSAIELCSVTGDISEYKIAPYQKHRPHKVTYNSSTGEVFCSCKKFEFAGILCSHALKMLGSRNIARIPEIYISKRWTKKAKKGLTEGLPIFSSDKHGEPMNETDDKKMIGVRCKELGRMYNQIATRAALTSETYEILKDAFLKASEHIDSSLEKGVTTESSFRPQSLAKGITVSRVSSKQTLPPNVCNKESLLSGPVPAEQHLVDEIDNLGAAADNVVIRGWKVKEQKRARSGKRLRSGLEKATRKRKTKPNIVSSSNNSIPLHVQNLNNSRSSLSYCASVGASMLPCLPQLPYLSQSSQANPVGMSSLSTYYPTEGHSSLHDSSFQVAQFNNTPLYSKNDQHNSPSLSQLLQEQINRKK